MEDLQSCFVLIDLYSQRKAVNRYVRGWSWDEILVWLEKHGTVTEDTFHRTLPWKQYYFEPFICSGLITAFNFDGDPAMSEKHRIVVIQPDMT